MGEKDFIRYLTEVIDLSNKEKYIEVIERSDRLKVLFPDRARKPILWKATALAHLGRQDEAMKELIEGTKEGEWWHPESLTRVDVLKSLHNHEEFRRVIELGLRKVDELSSCAKTELQLREGREQGPSILTFHWRGSNAEDFSEYWIEEDRTTTFGFAQSSQVYEKDAFCWDDPVQTERDVEVICEQFQDVKRGPLIFAGASQGGKIALETALKNKMGAAGFIVFAPAIKTFENIEQSIVAAKERGLRGSVIVGKDDFMYDRFQKLKTIMDEVQFPYQWVEVPNLGHYFPEHFPALLSEAMDYVLRNQQVGEPNV